MFCKHGATCPGNVTVSLNRGDTVVVIKDVPAEVCENCGEYFLSEETTEQVLSRAEDAVRKGAELEILRFAA
jgi:YgiT-type zinc finger domain-containing protein